MVTKSLCSVFTNYNVHYNQENVTKIIRVTMDNRKAHALTIAKTREINTKMLAIVFFFVLVILFRVCRMDTYFVDRKKKYC